MNTKHTPGPWNVRLSAHEGSRHVIEDAAENLVTNLSQKTSEADARLLAAAPEMLAALKEISEYAPEGMLLNVRKAIAKAEGKQE